MAEVKKIPTVTVSKAENDITVEIITFPSETLVECPPLSGNLFFTELPNIVESLIAEIWGKINLQEYLEGELMITVKNYPQEITFWIDNQGDFYIKSEDSDKYSINDMGELIYEFCG